jgi:uncharacterized membrane protein
MKVLKYILMGAGVLFILQVLLWVVGTGVLFWLMHDMSRQMGEEFEKMEQQEIQQ